MRARKQVARCEALSVPVNTREACNQGDYMNDIDALLCRCSFAKPGEGKSHNT